MKAGATVTETIEICTKIMISLEIREEHYSLFISMSMSWFMSQHSSSEKSEYMRSTISVASSSDEEISENKRMSNSLQTLINKNKHGGPTKTECKSPISVTTQEITGSSATLLSNIHMTTT